MTVGEVEPVRQLLHLAFDENVTALYGLNGSGKSRILALVEMALAGVRWEQDLLEDERQESVLDVHLRVQDVSRLSGFYSGELANAIRSSLRTTEAELAIHDAEADDPDAEADPLVRLARLKSRLERRSRGTESSAGDALWEAALVEGASHGRITLRATGGRGRGSWDAYLAVSSGDEFGALALNATGEWFEELRAGTVREARANRLYEDLQAPFHLDSWPYWSRPSQGGRGDRFPRHLQVPVLQIGSVRASEEFELVVEDSGRQRVVQERREGFMLAHVIGPRLNSDVDQGTLSALKGWTGTHFDGLLTNAGEPDPWIRSKVTALSDLANRLFHAVCPVPAKLEFKFGTPEDWLRGHPPAWFGDGMHVNALSGAQARWSHIAIAVANARMSGLSQDETPGAAVAGAPLVALLDEPELGLHRLLEHRLGNALNEIALASSGSCIVATHSPDLLASGQVKPTLVSMSADGTRARPVQVSVVDGLATGVSAAELGLSVGDLWALARLTVVVEGVHDEWVFANLIRESLDAAVAGIFPIHGAARLRSLAEARLLMHGTDAPVLIVLDDLDASLASELLAEIKTGHASSDPTRVTEALEKLRATKGDSYLFLHQFAHAALQVGSLDRIHVHGLSRPDVICYLPPQLLLDTAADADWEDLLSRWRADAAPLEPSNLKKWLRGKGLLPQDPRAIDARIEQAANEVRRKNIPIHPDLVGLGLRIVELGQGRS